MPRAEYTLNPARAIKLAADKVLAIEKMREAGLKTVACFTTWEDAVAASRGGIILGRTRKGFGGRGIVVYDPASLHEGRYPEFPLRPHEWYTIYEEPVREFRLPQSPVRAALERAITWFRANGYAA